jgi:hypothetical protein
MADPLISRGLGNIAQTAGELSKMADKGGTKSAPTGRFEQIRADQALSKGGGTEATGRLAGPTEVSQTKDARADLAQQLAAKEGITYQPIFSTPQTQATGEAMWQATPQKVDAPPATDFMKGVDDSAHRLEGLTAELASGKQYSPQELLGLQAEVFMLSEQIQVASKLVDASLQSLKSVMQQQI